MNSGLSGRKKFQKFKKAIFILSSFYKLLPIGIRIKMFEFHRMTNGLTGIALRYALIKSIANKCGDNVSIYPGVYLLRPEKITLGENVSIHPMSYIDATGVIIIGNNVSIAHGSTIMSTSHRYENLDIPIKEQGIDFSQTIIRDNVWIGAKATILYGVVIESGSIIAANAVVTKDVAKNSVVAGIPAKFIKSRCLS